MISRVADHCFWLGRYVERAESAARVLYVTHNLALDTDLSAVQCWRPVVIVAGEQARFEDRFGVDASDDAERVQRYMTWDEANPTSILRSVQAARWNARAVREALSLETFEALNELYLWLGAPAALELYGSNRFAFYRHVQKLLQLLQGYTRSTMLQDSPLDFFWLGVQLERAGQTARIIDVHHHGLREIVEAHAVYDTALWLSLLRTISGFEPFMKLHQGAVAGDQVAAFLVLEPRFPRSLRYCVHSAYRRLCSIRPPDAHALPGGRTLERLRLLDEWLGSATAEALRSDGIHALLTHVVDESAAICTSLGQELLGYPAPAPDAAADQ